MNAYQIRPIVNEDRKWVVDLLEEWWAGPKIITLGKVHFADRLPGFIAVYQGKPSGLITYDIQDSHCEVATMNSLVEGIGIGSALIEAVKRAATEAGCRRLWLITTNDNTAALRFYQKRGFSLVAVHRDAAVEFRRLKPEIPLTGNDGIPPSRRY